MYLSFEKNVKITKTDKLNLKSKTYWKGMETIDIILNNNLVKVSGEFGKIL